MPTSATTATPLGDGMPGLLALLIVVACILLFGWFGRKWRSFGRSGDAPLRHVDELALGPKHRLLLVEVRGRELLLAITEERIEHLTLDAAESRS